MDERISTFVKALSIQAREIEKLFNRVEDLEEEVARLKRRQSSYVTHTGGNDWNVVVGADYTTPPKIEEP